MGPFVPTPTSEGLENFLQGLAPGAHVAVNLGKLDMGVAINISRQVAQMRSERFIVIGHRDAQEPELVADSLANALPLETFASPRRKAWVVVDAHGAIAAQGAQEHAEAETRLGLKVAQQLTVVCFYTEDAVALVTPGRVDRLHTIVAKQV